MKTEESSSSLPSTKVLSPSSFIRSVRKEEKELEGDDDNNGDDDEENRLWNGFFENMTNDNNLDAEDEGKDDDDDDDQDNNDNYSNKGLIAGRSLSYSIIKTEEKEEAPDSIPSKGNMCVEDDNSSMKNSINNNNALVWGEGTKTTGLLANAAVQQQQPQQQQANTTIDGSIIPDVTTTRGNISESTSDKFSIITGRKRKGEYDATDDDNKKATNETILHKDNDDNGVDDTDHDYEDVDEDDGETLALSSSQKKKMRHSTNYGTNNIPKVDNNSNGNNKAVNRIFEQEEENEEWQAYSQQQQEKYHRIAMGNEFNDLTAQQIIIEYPNQSDIISGQGKCIMNHPGNAFFRNLVYAKLDEYIKLKSPFEKVRFTSHIVYLLKDKYGARFLKKGTIESDKKSDYWIEIPDEHARSKVRVCFRDKIKQQQQQHKQQQQQQLIYQQQQYIQQQQQQHKAELEAKIEKQKRREKNK